MSYLHYYIASTCLDPSPSHSLSHSTTHSFQYPSSASSTRISPPSSSTLISSGNSPIPSSHSAMASLNNNWFASAPTMLSPPVQPLAHSTDLPTYASPASTTTPNLSSSPSALNIPIRSHASRKRSRDEFSSAHEDPSASSHLPHDRSPSPPKKPMVEAATIHPDSSQIHHLGSESGTWIHNGENGATAASISQSLPVDNSTSAPVRPTLDSRKSQRLNGDILDLDDASLHNSSDVLRNTVMQAPTIDEATLTLGIGWTVMPSSMEAATRGWARFIENHYPLQSVSIFWQNSALPAYLARAVCHGCPGYYLFDEDLAQCRMVAKSWERALDNLRVAPTQFEGAEVLTALRPGSAGTGTASMEEEVQLQNGGTGMDLD